MRMTVSPKKLSGGIAAVVSKSHMHRLLICAALGHAPVFIPCAAVSKDIRATAGCLSAMGFGVRAEKGGFEILPATDIRHALLDCGESGSTYRFLCPIVCALGCGARFALSGKLPQRPMDPLWSALEAHGASVNGKGTASPALSGSISAGRYEIPGNVSSQFVSGLLFALPLLRGDSVIAVIGNADSLGYINMTLDALKLFSVDIAAVSEGYCVRGGQYYKTPPKIHPEGDWSNAAFWFCAAAAGGTKIRVNGLYPGTSQGDSAVAGILQRFGARVTYEDTAVCVDGGSLAGTEIDVKDIPDLVPPLALAAAAAQGTTVFYNAERLRLKESDRMAAVCETINRLGGDAFHDVSTITIRGTGSLAGGEIDSHNDHRIAMLAACASVICENKVIINGAEAVEKSYPAFYEDFNLLGGGAKGESV